MMKKPRITQTLFPSLITSILLIIAIFPIIEYKFYILLRWLVCFTAIFIAYFAYQEKKINWMWMMGIIAIVFNPIRPIHLNKGIWQVIDFFAAVIFVVTIYVFGEERKRQEKL